MLFRSEFSLSSATPDAPATSLGLGVTLWADTTTSCLVPYALGWLHVCIEISTMTHHLLQGIMEVIHTCKMLGPPSFRELRGCTKFENCNYGSFSAELAEGCKRWLSSCCTLVTISKCYLEGSGKQISPIHRRLGSGEKAAEGR